MNKKQKKNLQRIIIALILVLILKLLPQFPTPVELLLYCIPYLVVGWDVLRKALLGIKNRQPFDECFLMAVATSIDALAVGITFACVPVEIMAASQLVNTVVAVCLIGLTTFTISCIGVKAGSVFGARYKSKAEFVGGAILILIGIKILLEHLGVL